MTAAQIHQMMLNERQALEDRNLIVAADNVLASGKFEPTILEAIRCERDLRQARLDEYLSQR